MRIYPIKLGIFFIMGRQQVDKTFYMHMWRMNQNIGYQQYVWMEDEEEMVRFRGVYGSVRFGSVRFLSKKITKLNFFFKKKPKPVQTDWFRLGFFRAKTGSTSLARFFRFGSVFFHSVLPVPSLKNQNRTEPVGFFKILIGLIGFLVFLNTPSEIIPQ